MIHYKWPRAELEKAVDAADPGWRKHAEAKTKALVTAGEFTEATNDHTWSVVKEVFAQRQGNKCIFCERLLASDIEKAWQIHEAAEAYLDSLGKSESSS